MIFEGGACEIVKGDIFRIVYPPLSAPGAGLLVLTLNIMPNLDDNYLLHVQPVLPTQQQGI